MIGVGILILILLGGGGWYLMKGQKKAPGQKVAQTSEAVNEPTTAPQMSLKELLTAGVPQKCTFT